MTIPNMSPDVSIVVPVFNEEANVSLLTEAITIQLVKLNFSYEVMFIDDGSKDRTWQEILKLCENNKQIKGLKLSKNFGKEAALRAGLEHTRGDCVITMDADLQHPPELIPEMIDLILNRNYEVVDAVKEKRQQESIKNKVFAKLFYAAFQYFSGVDIANSSDFRALSLKAKKAYLGLSEAGMFYRGLSIWIGFKRAQIYFTPSARVTGRSQWSFFSLCRLGIRAITAFSSAPLHIVTGLGLVFAVISLTLGMQTLYKYSQGEAVPGFTTVILLQLIIGTITLIGLGIVGEYMARIYDEVKRRPHFLIDETK